ncbi:MAG TPA: hypothetical protein VGK73_21735 [Polyangiaceae bacterium]
MNGLRCFLCVVCVVLWAARVDAATVAVLRPASDAPKLDEALFRLQGELLAVGLSVAVAARPPFRETDSAEARAWFEQTSAAGGIDAFIDVVGDTAPVAVDVWICERSPRHLRLSRVMLDPDADDAAATLAIRTIEVLRSSFLALDFADQQGHARAPAAPKPAVEAPSRPERASAFGVEAGASALTSFDGVGPALLPLLRIDWAISSGLSVQATGAGFGTRPRVEGAAGSVEVAQQFVLFGLCACAPSGTGIQPIAALGMGALHTGLDGEATLPNLGHRVDRWSLLVDGNVGARLNLHERWYLKFASHVQVAAPYVAIHFVDTVVATTGRPNLLFALTAGARL